MSSLFEIFFKKIRGKRKTINNDFEIDLNKIAPQELDPRTLKPIVEVVMQSDQFIVTIDNALSINWMTNDRYTDYATDFSAVTAKVQLLSAQIHQLLAHKGNRYKYKKIVAEALALALHERKSDNALALLTNVENRIKEYGKEGVRMAYIFYAFFTTLFIIVLLGVSIQNKNSSWLFAGDINSYQLSVATLLGGIGAFVSAFVRFKNYEGNIIAGLSMHRLDGLLRVLYGCIAALILSLAIYSNIILGFLNNTTSGNQSWVIYFLAIIAGATEFLIPNFIKNTENAGGAKTKPLLEEKDDDDNSKNKITEKTVMIYKNRENGNEELVNIQAEGVAENMVTEKTTMLYENENDESGENDENDIIKHKQNEELVKIQEENVAENILTEKTIVLYENENENNESEEDEEDDIIQYKQNEEPVNMQAEDVVENTLTEKKLYENENNESEEEDIILYKQNEEPIKTLEEIAVENALTEKTVMLYENENNENEEDEEDDRIMYKQNEEPVKIQEEDAGKNTLTENPIMIYENENKENGEDEQNDRILHKQNEEPGKIPGEIKITRQLVQGKINLQDY